MAAKRFLGGVLLGGAIGAVLGLLFAPSEGSETRGKISEAAKSAGHKIEGVAEQVKEKLHKGEDIKQSV